MPKFGTYSLVTTPDGDDIFLIKHGASTNGIKLSQIDSFISAGGVSGAKESKVISSGIVAVTGHKRYALTPEAGNSDDLEQVTGLSEGEEARFYGTTGNAITVKDGANMKLQLSADCILEGPDDFIQIEGTSVAGVCREINRMGGEG